MATESDLVIRSFIAGESLVNDQYKFVVLNGTGREVVKASAAGVVCVGVLQNNPAAGESASVAVLGATKLKVGTGVTLDEGTLVATDANACAKVAQAATANTSTGALTGAIAMGVSVGAGGQGTLVSVLLKAIGLVPGTFA